MPRLPVSWTKNTFLTFILIPSEERHLLVPFVIIIDGYRKVA